MKKQVAIISTVLTFAGGGLFWAQASSTPSLEERVKALEARVQALEARTGASTVPAVQERAVTPPPATATSLIPPASVVPVPVAPTASPVESPKPAAVAAESLPLAERWKSIELWKSKLSKDMTKAQVEDLFGKPNKSVSYGRAGDRWWYGYPDGGTIDFTLDGRVESWLEPRLK